MSDRYEDHPPLKVEALRDLIEGGGEPFKRTPRSYILWCPDCKRQKMYVEKTTGMTKCFRCGTKGWANWMLARVYNRSSEELNEFLYGIVTALTAIHELKVRPDFWGEEEAEEALIKTPPPYPPVISRDPDWTDITDPAAEAGAAYLAKRGVPLDIAAQYGIGFHVADQRVLFPVIVEGELRGWQGRYIHRTEFVGDGDKLVRIPKAVTTGKLGKDCFMFQDRLTSRGIAVLTEGPFDGLKCHYIGGNVVSMGKDVSPRQLDILLRAGTKILYVGLDRDAHREVSRIVRELCGVVTLKRLLPPDHRNDLGDCTFEEVAVQAERADTMTLAHERQGYRPMPNLWA